MLPSSTAGSEDRERLSSCKIAGEEEQNSESDPRGELTGKFPHNRALHRRPSPRAGKVPSYREPRYREICLSQEREKTGENAVRASFLTSKPVRLGLNDISSRRCGPGNIDMFF